MDKATTRRAARATSMAATVQGVEALPPSTFERQPRL